MRIEHKIVLPLIMICIGNLVGVVIDSGSLFYYITHVGLFVVITLALFMYSYVTKKTNEKILSWSLLTISCIGTWYGGDTSLISATLLCFAIHITPLKKIQMAIYATCQIASIIIQLTVLNLSSSQTIVYLAGTAFIFIFYHHYIHPKQQQESIKIDYLKSPVPKDVVDILSLRIQGFQWHEINVKLNLNVTDDRIRRKITEERKRQGFDNQEAFIFYLTDSGVISPVSYNQQNLEKESNLVC